MRSGRPLRLAKGLLLRLAAGPTRESLIGDLDEQFARGRTSSWYWRQVLSAIWVTAANDLRDHKLVAVRAVLAGWALLIPSFYAAIAVYLRIPETWIPGAWSSANSVLLRVAWWAWWIYEVPLLIAWYGAAVIGGWLIARLHAQHRTAAVFACVAFQLRRQRVRIL